MDINKLSAWLSLSLTPTISCRIFHLLLDSFSEPSAIYKKDLALINNTAMTAELKSLLHNCREHQTKRSTQTAVQKALRWQEKDDQHLVTFYCESYPKLLKEIPDPPPLLYVKGRVESLSLSQIAMVGTRLPSPGGRVTAMRLAGELAQAGYIVCSGMALGIDAESHIGAIKSGGQSTAVLGCGVDVIYPSKHKELAKKLSENGALVSEFALGTQPKPWHFPQRNRVISGLSQGLVVVEAALKSGSLITARYALDQGREVFAVPGSLRNQMAKGCNHLLRQGAKLVENAQDIVDELGAFQNVDRLNVLAKIGSEISNSKGLSRKAKHLLKCLDDDTSSVDTIIQRSGLQASEITGLLIELELEGLVISRAGGYSLYPS